MNAFLVVLVACVLRLAVAGWTGLGIDESYMVASTREFAASYFDHPLASWWLELGSRWLFGGQSPVVVRLPFVVLSAVSSWLLFGLTRRLYGADAAFWAVVAYTISPVFSLAFGCWVLPDGPLDAALLAFAICLARAVGVGGAAVVWWWLGVGVFAGLAMLSKYNAALVLLGGAVFVFVDRVARVQLRRWQLWAAVVIALSLVSPVVLWNAAHGWQSLQYQAGRAAGSRLHPLAPFSILGGEALFVLPWLWLPMVVLLGRALWRGAKSRADFLLAMLGVLPVVLFAAMGIWSSAKILYHWATPGYLLLMPLLGNWAAGARWRRLRDAVAAGSAFLLAAAALLIAAEVHFNFIPNLDRVVAPGKSPLLQAVDWTSLRGQVPAGVAVATLRWYDAGKIGYALPGTTVTVFGPEPHEFGVTAPAASLIGHDVVLVAMPGDVGVIQKLYAADFKSLTAAPALTVTDHGAVLLVIPTLLGHDLLRTP